MKAVITVIGQDTVGVVAKVSAVCAELNINIEDVSQSIMQNMFCMIMLVDLSKANAEAAEVRDRFAALGKEMKMQVTVTRQEVFDECLTEEQINLLRDYYVKGGIYVDAGKLPFAKRRD